MAVRGEFGGEMPEAAIFADTQWEPVAVYEWLNELERIGGLVIPIHRVTAGNLRDVALGSKGFASIPLNVRSLKGNGKLRRQCTREYKVAPITKEIRRLLGVEKGRRVRDAVELWMGISLDEIMRMKPNISRWIKNRWPLIEREMNRRDCEKWLNGNGYPTPPKSACIGCPYTDNRRWREMKDNRPEEWKDAVDFDNSIRTLPRIKGEVFVHRSLKPLDEVDLLTDAERGQDDLFAEECEGLCGV